MLTTAVNAEWVLIINPTVAGVDAARWQDITDSALQYDISRTDVNTVSGGYKVGGGYLASTNQAQVPIAVRSDSFLGIGSKIDGTVDELVFAIANIDGNGGTCYGGITLNEYC